MADGVLPALLVLVVVGEPLNDKAVDAVEGDPTLWRAFDRHGDERDVRVGRLLRMAALLKLLHHAEGVELAHAGS